MTADQIERAAQAKTDRLDATYMSEGNAMTKAEYDAKIAEIAAWTERQWQMNPRAAR